MGRSREFRVLACLFLAVAAVAGAMLALGRASWLEAFSFVTGALCVWLTVRESVWNFPVSMASVAAFLFVFSRAGLYADAGLQIVYFVLSGVGWYLWLFGGRGHTRLRIGRTRAPEAAIVALAGATLTLGLTLYLRHVGGAAPFLDALTTSLSLCAQWLLNRKRLESWWLWITVDVLYIPLYLSRGLALTSILYAVFLVMATLGLLEWRRRWIGQLQQTAAPLAPLTPAAA